MRDLGNIIKKYWWVALLVIIAPILINYLILKPAFFRFVGEDTDWLSFWGAYIGTILSSVIAFYVLHKQLQQNHDENEANRKLQMNFLEYQQKIAWLNDLKIKLSEYFIAFDHNEWIFIREDIILKKDREDIRKRLRILVDRLNRVNFNVMICVSNCSDDMEKQYINELNGYSGEFWALFDDIDWYVFLRFPYKVNNNGVKKQTGQNEHKVFECKSQRIWVLIESLQYNVSNNNKEIISRRINSALSEFSYEKMTKTIKEFIDYEQKKINKIIQYNDATK